MAKRKKDEISLKDLQSMKAQPRVIKSDKENEGFARFYSGRGRMTLPKGLLERLKITAEYFELYIDKGRELIVLNFGEKTSQSFKAYESKGGSRFIELKGSLNRAGLSVVPNESPVLIEIKKNAKEGFIYFSFGQFAQEKKE